jgi:hypothetical protein
MQGYTETHEQSETWLLKLCTFPLIGDWATTIVGLLPIGLLAVARALAGVEGDPGPWFFIVSAIALIPWLIILERWQGIRINTPYLPIKWLWIIPILLIGSIWELFA